METVGILIVSYGAREVAIVDTLTRSQNYKVEFILQINSLIPLTFNMLQNMLLFQT